jgi:hypothetical protein
MSKHFDHTTGTQSIWDLTTGKEKFLPVRWIDPDVRPDGLPQFPDLAFREKFAKAFLEAMATVNKNADRKMVFDDARNNGFVGQGFMNGHLTFFVVREDKAGIAEGAFIKQFSHADYRFEANDRDSAYSFSNYEAMLKEFVSRMATVQQKA